MIIFNKHPLTLIFFIQLTIQLSLTLSASQTQAEVLRWAQPCSQGELTITNTTSHEITTWLQQFTKGELQNEDEIIVKANSSLKYDLKINLNEKQRVALFHTDERGSLQAEYQCSTQATLQKNQGHSFEGGQMTFRHNTSLNYWIQNLQSSAIILHVERLNRLSQSIDAKDISVAAGEKILFSPEAHVALKYIRFSSADRYAAFAINEAASTGPLLIAAQPSKIDFKAHYFLVSTRSDQNKKIHRQDSFVIKITDPVLIEQARNIILNPQQEKIVFAKIKIGSDGINRNWSHSEKSFWSWSTSEVTGFGDLASTACNGLPQFIEDHVESWVQDPGQICFWSYRLHKELSASEVENPTETPQKLKLSTNQR